MGLVWMVRRCINLRTSEEQMLVEMKEEMHVSISEVCRRSIKHYFESRKPVDGSGITKEPDSQSQS